MLGFSALGEGSIGGLPDATPLPVALTGSAGGVGAASGTATAQRALTGSAGGVGAASGTATATAPAGTLHATMVRQTASRFSGAFDDTLSSGLSLESASSVEGDLNALRAQTRRVFGSASWYSPLPTTNDKQRSISALNSDLDDIEEQRLLARVSVAADVTVPAGAGYVVLSVSGNEAPTLTAAPAGDVDGAVVATSASFASQELLEVAGANAVDPKNLCLVRDAATGLPVSSDGRDVFALLQYEATGASGAAFNDEGARVKLSFVRLTSGLDDLEACPSADVEGKTINYSYVRRLKLSAMPEEFWLNGSTFTDHASQVDVTAQLAHTNQGATAVTLALDASFALAAGGGAWRMQNASLVNVLTVNTSLADVIGSASATTVGLASASFGGSLAVSGAATVGQEVTVAGAMTLTGTLAQTSGAVRIGDVAATYCQLAANSASTIAGNLALNASTGKVALHDGHNADIVTGGLKLATGAADWTGYHGAFGASSIMLGLVRAKNAASTSRSYAKVEAAVAVDDDVGGVNGGANLDVALASMSAGDFAADYVVFLNGEIQRPGLLLNTLHDYYPGTDRAQGQLKFKRALAVGDVICVVAHNGQSFVT